MTKHQESSRSLQYRVGMIGHPVRPGVPWTADNVRALQALGFNTLQLNVAWGYRPGDEPLNLEDVLDVLPHEVVPSNGHRVIDQSPQARDRRRRDLRHRVALCRELGARSIFHFGAPFTGGAGYRNDPLPVCVQDPAVHDKYDRLVRAFAAVPRGR